MENKSSSPAASVHFDTEKIRKLFKNQAQINLTNKLDVITPDIIETLSSSIIKADPRQTIVLGEDFLRQIKEHGHTETLANAVAASKTRKIHINANKEIQEFFSAALTDGIANAYPEQTIILDEDFLRRIKEHGHTETLINAVAASKAHKIHISANDLERGTQELFTAALTESLAANVGMNGDSELMIFLLENRKSGAVDISSGTVHSHSEAEDLARALRNTGANAVNISKWQLGNDLFSFGIVLNALRGDNIEDNKFKEINLADNFVDEAINPALETLNQHLPYLGLERLNIASNRIIRLLNDVNNNAHIDINDLEEDKQDDRFTVKDFGVALGKSGIHYIRINNADIAAVIDLRNPASVANVPYASLREGILEGQEEKRTRDGRAEEVNSALADARKRLWDFVPANPVPADDNAQEIAELFEQQGTIKLSDELDAITPYVMETVHSGIIKATPEQTIILGEDFLRQIEDHDYTETLANAVAKTKAHKIHISADDLERGTQELFTGALTESLAANVGMNSDTELMLFLLENRKSGAVDIGSGAVHSHSEAEDLARALRNTGAETVNISEWQLGDDLFSFGIVLNALRDSNIKEIKLTDNFVDEAINPVLEILNQHLPYLTFEHLDIASDKITDLFQDVQDNEHLDLNDLNGEQQDDRLLVYDIGTALGKSGIQHIRIGDAEIDLGNPQSFDNINTKLREGILDGQEEKRTRDERAEEVNNALANAREGFWNFIKVHIAHQALLQTHQKDQAAAAKLTAQQEPQAAAQPLAQQPPQTEAAASPPAQQPPVEQAEEEQQSSHGGHSFTESEQRGQKRPRQEEPEADTAAGRLAQQRRRDGAGPSR